MVVDLDAIESTLTRACQAVGGFCVGLALGDLASGNRRQAAAWLAIVGAAFCLHRLHKSIRLRVDEWIERQQAKRNAR